MRKTRQGRRVWYNARPVTDADSAFIRHLGLAIMPVFVHLCGINVINDDNHFIYSPPSEDPRTPNRIKDGYKRKPGNK